MNNSSYNILHDAVHREDVSEVRRILEDGLIDVNQIANEVDSVGRTPLILGCEMPQNPDTIEILKMLVNDERVDLNRVSWNGAALHVAARQGSEKFVSVLLACTRGLDVNLICDIIDIIDEGTPLIQAVLDDAEECVKLLLQDERVDVNLLNPLHWAVEESRIRAAAALLACERVDHNGMDPDFEGTLFCHACEDDTKAGIAMFRLFLKCTRVDVNAGADGSGELFPLGAACGSLNVIVVKELLSDPRTDINGFDNKGRTAMMILHALEDRSSHEEIIDIHHKIISCSHEKIIDIEKLLLSHDQSKNCIRESFQKRCLVPNFWVKDAFGFKKFAKDALGISQVRLLKREAFRVKSDRARLAMVSENSAVHIPREVLQQKMFPWVGQSLVTPDFMTDLLRKWNLADDVPVIHVDGIDTTALNAMQLENWRASMNRIILHLTRFIYDYGVPEDFPMLDFSGVSSIAPLV